jgi:phosphopantetheinyl transferase (holo-ACP synthase)
MQLTSLLAAESEMIPLPILNELVQQLVTCAPLKSKAVMSLQLFPVSTLDSAGVRGSIRKHVVSGINETVRTLSLEERESILDVRQRPQFSDFTYSISHTGTIAAFTVMQDAHAGIGIDVESASRVTERVCHRVCASALELASSPTPAMLWTAKEAAFKALSNFSTRNHESAAMPEVISQIEIVNWQIASDNIWTFEFTTFDKPENAHFGCGAAVEAQNLSLSLAVSL